MKSNAFLKRILNNWLVKMISLLAAVILYFLNSFYTLETAVFDVPLTVVLPENYALAAPHRESISFTVKGKAKWGVPELTAADFAALAILPEEKLEPGPVQVLVEYEKRGRALEMEQGRPLLDVMIQPAQVEVRIEERMQKTVPVIPDVTGGPEEGFEVLDSGWVPTRVKISGAASRLQLIDRLRTESISYDGHKKDFFVTVPLVVEDPLIRVDDPPYIDFTAYITEILTERVIDDVMLIPTFVNPLLEVNGSLPVGTINLKAPNQVLRNLRKESVRLIINCENIIQPGRYTLKTTPDIPATTTLISHSPREVAVDFIMRQ